MIRCKLRSTLRIALLLGAAPLFFAAAAWGSDALDRAASQAPQEAVAQPTSVEDPWTRDAKPLAATSSASSQDSNPAAGMNQRDQKPARTVLGLFVEGFSGGVLVRVEADGKIGVTRTQQLDDPARLVVDLLGLRSDVEKDEFEAVPSKIRSIRLRPGKGRVRVEFEANEEGVDFSSRRLVPVDDGLVIAVGRSEELTQALERAVDVSRGATAQSVVGTADSAANDDRETDRSQGAADAFDPPAVENQVPVGDEPAQVVAEKPVAPKATLSPVQIYGIHYESQPERERIVVLSRGRPVYHVLTPNPKTVVVSLPGSVISEDAAGRIEPDSGGPISLVTAFAQPDVQEQEVRVVIKREPGTVPNVVRHEGLLFIDFPKKAASGQKASRVARSAKASPSEARAFLEQNEPMLLHADQDEPTGVQRAEADFDTEWRRTAMDPVLSHSQAGPVPAAPAQAIGGVPIDLLEEGGLQEDKTYQGRRISLDFKDVPVSDVLRLVAEVSDLNVVAGDEVKGKVTIRMMDVPWDQALDVILMTKGLGFVRVGNVLRIAPKEVLHAEAEMRLQERRNREKLEDLIVKIHSVNYANVGEAADLVERLLTERGTVNKDERTSTLIIKDIPSVVEEAIALVDAIDTQTPQVLIEAKIVEANLDFSRELGSKWSIGSQQYADGFTKTGHNRTLGGDGFRLHDANNLAFANPITGVHTAAAALNAFLLDDQINLDIQLQAREATGETKVISSPRIVTMDNRKAEIEQGVSIPFQTFEQGDVNLEFVDAVLSLTVTPHITADKSIIMELELTRNAPSDVPNATGSPSIAKNVARTETLVRDGQTLVLGGIYTLTKAENHTAVPYLNRIPILGGAFQSKRVRDDRKELLMFVTPRILVDPASG